MAEEEKADVDLSQCQLGGYGGGLCAYEWVGTAAPQGDEGLTTTTVPKELTP